MDMLVRAVAVGVALSIGILITDASTSGQGFASSTGGRPDAPVDGVLTSRDGQPLAGVQVAGSRQLRCCPFKDERVESDAAGRFHLEHPGTVLQFFREDLRPEALVLKAADSLVRVVLHPSADSLHTVVCGKASRRRDKLAGSHVRFSILDSSLRVHRGTTDVDYVRHLIESKARKSILEIWFGPYAMDGYPADDTFINSSVFRERHVLSARGEIIGLDSWGTWKNGRRWRQVSIASEGAVYRDATPEDADLFDRVINSACTNGDY